MLNPFPTMWLALLAYFVLRVIVASSLFFLGLKHLRKSQQLQLELRASSRFFFPGAATIIALSEITLAIFILLGYGTQYACLVGLVFAGGFILFRNKIQTTLFPSRHYYLILSGALLSLFITGAGAFAFDLPL